MSKDLVEFRLMQKSDAAEIAAIEKASFSDPWSQLIFEYAAESYNNLFIVGLIEDEIVAYVGAYLDYDDIEIINFAVKPEFRGQKLGKTIFSLMLNSLTKLGFEEVRLHVRKSNRVAIKLYETFGFKYICTIKYYYSDEDALLMKKILTIN